MITTTSLRPFISSESTLLITCFECHLAITGSDAHCVVRHTSVANSISVHHEEHYQHIKNYLLEYKCRKIVVVVNVECVAMRHLIGNKYLDGYLSNIQSNLKKIVSEYRLNRLSEEPMYKRLAEINVVRQCKAILEFDFVQKLVESKQLTVHGLLIEPKLKTCLELSRNEFQFNDSVSMN